MTWWLALAGATEVVDLDAAPPPASGFAPSGRAITGFGGAPGVGLGEQVVVGGDGGTSITTLSAQGTVPEVADGLTLAVRLPFAAYATPDQRDTGLGNLEVQALIRAPDVAGIEHAAGLAASVGLGGTAWTWASRADEVWPGGGVDGIYELRSVDGPLTWLGRGALGVHGSRGWEPVPRTWVRLLVAGGVDYTAHERVGLIAEASAAWWELAPVQLAALVRADPLDGLRLRGGLVLPPFTWFGWDPVGRPGGAREVTFRFDLAASF